MRSGSFKKKAKSPETKKYFFYSYPERVTENNGSSRNVKIRIILQLSFFRLYVFNFCRRRPLMNPFNKFLYFIPFTFCLNINCTSGSFLTMPEIPDSTAFNPKISIAIRNPLI
jgi:hypothetical protein